MIMDIFVVIFALIILAAGIWSYVIDNSTGKKE